MVAAAGAGNACQPKRCQLRLRLRRVNSLVVYLRFFRVVLTLQLPVSPACVCCVIRVRCGRCWSASSISSYFLLSEQGMHSFVFPQSRDQLPIIALGLLLLMSGNFPFSLSLCFIHSIYIFYTVVSNQHICASLWDVWLVCAYIHPLSVPGITLLDGGDTNSSMT